MLQLVWSNWNYRAFIKYAMETCQYFSIVLEKDDFDDCSYHFEKLYNTLKEDVYCRKSIGYHPDTGTYYFNCDIVYFKCNPFTRSILSKADAISEWNGVYWPEELCFYRNNTKWFTLISHEKYLFIYNETKLDKLFLENEKIQYIQCE